MPQRYHRQLAFFLVAFVFFVVVLLFSPPAALTRANWSTLRAAQDAIWQAQIRQLDDQLRDPRFLLLRTGAFDPLQSEPPAVRIGSRQLEATNLAARSARLTANAARQVSIGGVYYIVQYSDRILPAQEEQLRSGGAEIVGYVANNAYIVRAAATTANKLQSARQRGDVRWLGAYGAGLKVEPTLAAMADDIATGSSAVAANEADQSVAVSFLTFRGETSTAVRQALSDIPLETEPIIEERNDERVWGVIFTSLSDLPNVVTILASVEGIEWVEQRRPQHFRNDTGVRVIQSGVAGSDTPLYRNGLTGAGQIYGAADSGLDDDHAQFRLNGQASSQTLSFAVTTRSLVNGLLPVSITNPNNKVLTYYVLGSGDLIDNPSNPNGGKALDPAQRRGTVSNPRYLNAVSYDDSDGGYHGTATTSVAAGRDFNADGTGASPGIPSRTSGDGVAPDARIVFQDVGHPSGQLSGVDNISQALIHQQAYSSGVRVHNNSYGPSPPVSYDEDAADIDDAMWRLRDYSIFYSAGNDGAAALQVTNAAKNNVLVAATSSPTNGGSVENVASYSSHGPTSDGRIKPDIAAPGTVRAATEDSGTTSTYGNLTSRTAQDAAVNPADPDNNRSMALTGGTSFSSPMVAGGALLVRQYFTDGYYPNGVRSGGTGFTPSNALVKAVILNSGRNMTGRYTASDGRNGASGPLPNYGQGWGRVALDDSLYFAGDRRQLKVVADIYNGATSTDSSRPAPNAAIATGETHSYQVGNVTTIDPLRISLVWSDPKAMLGAQVALVNNLDLEVTDPQGKVYRGNANFANAYSQPANGAGFDNRNPVEAIYIASPAAGTYTVRVIGANVPGNGSRQILAQPGNQLIDSNRQGYALIVTGNFGSNIAATSGTSASVDAASFVRAAAPGQILAAFGAGFPVTTNLSAAAAIAPLPTELGSVSVRVNGILAPLFFVGISAGTFQINYQLPYEISPGSAYVEMLSNGTAVASENLTVSSAAPGVFTVASSGQGQAAALNQDSSRNGDPTQIASAKPESRGRYISIYANGQGGQFVNPGTGQAMSFTSGVSAPTSGLLYATAVTPAVTIGGITAAVSFSGLAPGFVGLWQLNVLIPGNAPTGNAVPLVISTGGRTGNIVMIAIN
ncbi:MAG: S8 family serine peptidase [Acidobacteriota bacterium]